MVDGPKVGRRRTFLRRDRYRRLSGPREFETRVDGIIDEVHGSRARAGVSRLLVPGEIEADFEATHDRDGIPLAATTVDDIAAAADALGVDASELFVTD